MRATVCYLPAGAHAVPTKRVPSSANEIEVGALMPKDASTNAPAYSPVIASNRGIVFARVWDSDTIAWVFRHLKGC